MRHETRYAVLNTWLRKNDAQFIRAESFPNGDELSWVFVKGCMILIQEYIDHNGWEAFIPAGNSNRVDSTIKALDRYMRKATITEVVR